MKQEKFHDLFLEEAKIFYVRDCQLDTDLEILIPETYVINISERLNLYKELNTFKNEDEISDFDFEKGIKVQSRLDDAMKYLMEF